MQEGCALRLKESFKPPLPAQSVFGQLQEIVSPSEIKVNLMVRNGDKFELGSEDELVTVPISEVAQHCNIMNLESLGSHRRAWRSIGLRLTKASDTKADVFVRIDEIDVTKLQDIGDYDSEEEDKKELLAQKKRKRERPGSQGYQLNEWLVDDEEEVFTEADPEEDEFVADTHEAVHDFEDWVPQTAKEKEFFRWMQRFEARITQKDDEGQFARGTQVHYSRPKRAKKKKKKRK